jgi:hypothetical protein
MTVQFAAAKVAPVIKALPNPNVARWRSPSTLMFQRLASAINASRMMRPSTP